ncbi:hypothetical protein Y1Q_0011813 [Alligator mississippiensis]|uniref:Uncharacterized protein n=1 Tax=Alligator mississippiensis TaxID=8496 RepID=A0A151NR24_ALLMI|nr:hypothetical protein Y1Q_0011813 [Alligator mississippiensis]
MAAAAERPSRTAKMAAPTGGRAVRKAEVPGASTGSSLRITNEDGCASEFSGFTFRVATATLAEEPKPSTPSLWENQRG